MCVRHGTHSFVSLILSAVFSIVSFSVVSFTVVSLLMIDSLHTRHGRRRWWMACTTCVLMKAARISGGWRVRFDSIRILDPPVASRPTVSQWPVTRARQPSFLTCASVCCHVRACASLARRTRVVRACRACSARACSCARRRAASAGVAVARRSPVRDMPLCAPNSVATELATERNA